MGLFSAIGGFISNCVHAVGSALSSVSRGIANAASRLAPVLVKLSGGLGTALQAISIAVEVISVILKIIKPDEKVEDIGDRALQAEDQGITLDSCDNDFNVYMRKIHNLDLDTEKSIHNKENYNALLAGCLTLEKGIEKFSSKMATADIWPILALNPDFFTNARMKTYANLAMERGVTLSAMIKNYFLNGCDGRIDRASRNFMWDAEKNMTPQASSEDIIKEFAKVEKNLQHDQS